MTRRQPIIIWIMLVALLCLPLAVIVDSLKKIQAVGQQITAEYEYLSSRDLQGQQINTLQFEYDRLTPNISRLSTLAITAGHEIDFITAVEAAANIHHVSETLNMNIDTMTGSGELQKIPLTMLVQGGYGDIVAFIDTLHDLPQVISIKGIDLHPVFSKPGVDTSAVMEGYVYLATKK